MEIDFLKYGNRREGILYSLFIFFQKLGLAIAVGISNIILLATDYKEMAGGEVPPGESSAVWGLRVMCNILPIVCILAGIAMLVLVPDRAPAPKTEVIDGNASMTQTDLESEIESGKDQ